jgi:phosphatidylinositol-3-phosphatase
VVGKVPLLLMLVGFVWGTVLFVPIITESTTLPRPDHIVIVIEENHSFSQILDSPDRTPNNPSKAPYINSLAQQGALFTQSFGVTHRSQPNYLALFSGSTQDIRGQFCKDPSVIISPSCPKPTNASDSCPHEYSTPNLASELREAGFTFGGYSEDLPADGTQCCSNNYVRRHNPWVNWQGATRNGVLASENRPFSAFPSPRDYSTLPTVSIVVPNLIHDMHEGTIELADQWLRDHLDAFVQWAKQNNSLLILTWDEDDCANDTNQILTIFVGSMVKPGSRYSGRVDHYRILRTIEDMYGLSHLANSAAVEPIADIWTTVSQKK